ncbi:helix-turn-helix transcriptional regulator, partial [Massilia cavernae]
MPSVSNPALFSTKITPPAIVPGQVMRPALSDLICNVNTAKLVLVRAPAGFGKTTAMIQARARLQEAGVDTAWLTLDSADNDASRFLASLAMATAHMAMYPGAPSAPLDTIALLAVHTSPFALFLDEFEAIQESAVLNLMREIIDHLPRGSQIVI